MENVFKSEFGACTSSASKSEPSYTLVESDFYAQLVSSSSSNEQDEPDIKSDSHNGHNYTDMIDHFGTDRNFESDAVEPPVIFSCRDVTEGDDTSIKAKKNLPQKRRTPQRKQIRIKATCAECGKVFASGSNLKQHMKIHTGEKSFHCRFCHKSFIQNSNLKAHEKLHTGDRPHKCKFCGKTFNKSTNLHSHETRLHTGKGNFQCANCDNAYFYKFELRNHMQKHSAIKRKLKGGQQFECLICGKGFDEEHQLKAHSLIHTEHRSHACDICEKSFRWRAELEYHKVTHAIPSTEFECLHCGENCDSKTAYELHMHSHTENEPISSSAMIEDKYTHLATMRRFPCTEPECFRRFETQALLDAHNKMHVKKKTLGLHCDICNKFFTTKGTLKTHNILHAKERPRPKIFCGICEKGFFYKSELAVHQKVHTGLKPFGCKVCGKTFMQKGSLTQHEFVHTGQCFRCDYEGCFRKYRYLSDLQYHRKVKHQILGTDKSEREKTSKDKILVEESNYRSKLHQPEKPKPFSCDKCSKTFAKCFELQKHKRFHAETYKCSLCNIKFVTDLLRNKHEETHKQHMCCSEKFETEIDYMEHLKMHMSKPTEMSHECSVCSKIFSGAPNLKMHEARVHGLSPFRCKLCVEGFQRASQLKEHETVHLKDTPHRCKHCSQPFLMESELADHMTVHAVAKSYQCDCCKIHFQSKEDLTKHDCQINGDIPFQCSLCDEAFNSIHNLEIHMNVHAQQEPCDELQTDKTPQAPENTHTDKTFQAYENDHTQFTCTFCNDEFITAENLNSHRNFCGAQLEHIGKPHRNPPNQCSICSKSFTQHGNMQKHLLTVHGVQPYSCEPCGLNFPLAVDLSRHCATKHPEKMQGTPKKIVNAISVPPQNANKSPLKQQSPPTGGDKAKSKMSTKIAKNAPRPKPGDQLEGSKNDQANSQSQPLRSKAGTSKFNNDGVEKEDAIEKTCQDLSMLEEKQKPSQRKPFKCSYCNMCFSSASKKMQHQQSH